MSGIVFLNGEYLPHAEARISVDDRGFLFGDGVYEMTPAYGGSFLRLGRHLDRLRFGLRELGIDFDPSGVETIHRELLERNGLEEAPMSTVYLQVTRGEALRAHHFPPPGTRPTVFAFGKGFQRLTPEEWERGSEAVTHPDRRWGRVDIKTLQLLPNAMAQQAAKAAGASDAIMIRDGLAVEGALSNLFLIFGETVRTHPTSNQILPGITRELVLELAREEGIEVEEKPTPVEALAEVTEVFLTGTTTEVKPVVRVDGRAVAGGAPGPVTRRLQRAFVERVARECGEAAPIAR
jgi:D-alanine transaminase